MNHLPANPGHDAAEREWRRSSRCSSSGCVEIAFAGDQIIVRNSKQPDGLALTYDQSEWGAFIAGAKAGEFDLPTESSADRR